MVEKVKNIKVLKEIVNRNFSFWDLNKKYYGMDSSTGNIFCPFHDNNNTPSAKFYTDDDGRLVIYCFSEHRKFTAYDYVNLVMCEKWGAYKDVWDFLLDKMDPYELQVEVESIANSNYELEASDFENKIVQINNIYNESEDIEEYIERMYNSYVRRN